MVLFHIMHLPPPAPSQAEVSVLKITALDEENLLGRLEAAEEDWNLSSNRIGEKQMPG